ncbi:MAG: energy-coupling factor transporter ATPase [Erysipelotrichaceae bacterium]|nr:energy-coupling factor transporter ATPase [Erysipelotrichaceae bacterium]MDO5084959.1 energy-coupling factor transporter ATPase [Erysipelotrichaceae bacterium]
MEFIEVKNLHFHYDSESHAVNDVSFGIPKGSYTTIIGHNGSGKSTIAKLLVGLLELESGEIYVDGLLLNLETINAIRNKVGIVFQNPDNQFIGSTVRDDIAFGLENRCVKPKDMEDIIVNYASKVNMESYLDSEPTKLSGGQKQRVAIAGVLAMHPEIIIFDESTSMLDPQGKEDINKVIRQLHADQNLTIISITHDIEEVSKSDYVIVMNQGKVAKVGKPSEVLLDEAFLTGMQLDIPFAVKLCYLLKEKGVEVPLTIDVERLKEELCQLNLKK